MDTNWTFSVISVRLKKQLLESGSGFVSSLGIRYQSTPLHLIISADYVSCLYLMMGAEPASRTLCSFNQNEIMENAQCFPHTIRDELIKGDTNI
jgi:hypothetical protein